jgi:hypothetical protein
MQTVVNKYEKKTNRTDIIEDLDLGPGRIQLPVDSFTII